MHKTIFRTSTVIFAIKLNQNINPRRQSSPCCYSTKSSHLERTHAWSWHVLYSFKIKCIQSGLRIHSLIFQNSSTYLDAKHERVWFRMYRKVLHKVHYFFYYFFFILLMIPTFYLLIKMHKLLTKHTEISSRRK